jgi:3-hydroxyacyl-CoA dehydrogenase / enoyl-CoA hydratase / 3-hydroxybutyryl-CoA epimerase
MKEDREMIQFDNDQEGIATLSWDMPGSANVLNADSVAAFSAVVEQGLADPGVKGILVTSSKESFVLGGDLKALYALSFAEEVAALGRAIHKVFRRLETGGKPVAVVLHGLALGGGLELALAGHYRIGTTHASTQLGFPEVTLGLLPGAGGTQRLPRLIGLQPALLPLLQGRQYSAVEAKQLGILQATAPDKSAALAEAKRWLQTGSPVQPWDRKGFEAPGADLASVETTFLYAGTAGMVRQQTGGNYPAPEAILSCLYEGLQMNFDQALELELTYFTKVALSKQAKHMIRTLWFAMNAAKAGAARPVGVPSERTRKLGILGAGMMGAGIAYVSAKAGIETVLKDTSIEAAEKGKDYSRKLTADQLAKGRIGSDKQEAILGRIQATGSAADLASCDLVIEAVYEDKELKARVTQEAEAAMSADGVFASNTSTLPISTLALASARPQEFIGLHFFSPVDKMQLVEVIRGKQTSDHALARSIDYVQQLKKVPIVVNDSRGFFTSRIFKTYVTEGLELLKEGVKPALIENAAKAAGMPVGPLAVADEVSIELLYKIRKQYALEGVVEQGALSEVVTLFVEELGRLGKKAGKGFYEYPADGKKRLWPGISAHYPLAVQQPDVEEVKRRLLHVQALESFRCLAEGVLERVADADIGSILGWGFPAYTGGVLSYIDFVGLPDFVTQCDVLAARLGERYSVPAGLLALSKAGLSVFDYHSI